MAITLPAELIGQNNLAIIDGRLVFYLISISPAFAFKGRVKDALNEAVSSFYASKISALREGLVVLS